MNYKRRNKRGYHIINDNFSSKKKKRFSSSKFSRDSILSYNIKKILIKLILIVIELAIFLYFTKTKKKIKIAICTMAKNENLYVKEFINYYEKLGIDNIFIYDDNDYNTERIKDVVPFTKKIKVEVYENIKERIKNQPDAYTECYNNNKNKFDWFLMIDLDEYLIIRNQTIRKYLQSPIFNKCDFIKIHWLIPTDNNLIYYDNRTLFERFPGPYRPSHHIKSIIRGNIDDLKYWIHSPIISPHRNITCDNAGEVQNYTNLNFQSIMKFTTEKAYFIHFMFKSTEEYVSKFKRGYSNWNWVRPSIEGWVFNYFKNNDINIQKIEYLEKVFNTSLDKYRKRIK